MFETWGHVLWFYLFGIIIKKVQIGDFGLAAAYVLGNYLNIYAVLSIAHIYRVWRHPASKKSETWKPDSAAEGA